MGFHHVALAVRDIEATHRFYTEAMGFELVKAVVAPTESGEGWAKHVFYDTGGGGLIAFWELHDPTISDDFDPRISDGLGLPAWVNHLAFASPSVEHLTGQREHWLDGGHFAIEVDHGFCRSIYTLDPSNILVEWCTDTAPYTEADKARALAVLRDPSPDLEDAPTPVFHEPHAPVAS